MKTMKTTLMMCMMIITMSLVPKRRGKELLMFVTYVTFALHYFVSEPYITNPSISGIMNPIDPAMILL